MGVLEQRGEWGVAMGERVFLPNTFYHHFVFCTNVNMPPIQKSFYFNNEIKWKTKSKIKLYIHEVVRRNNNIPIKIS